MRRIVERRIVSIRFMPGAADLSATEVWIDGGPQSVRNSKRGAELIRWQLDRSLGQGVASQSGLRPSGGR